MKKSLITAFVLVALLTACGQKSESQVEVKKAEDTFPVLTVDQLLKLNKNERAELERRCLGLTNQTCNDFKSDTFKQQDDLAKSFCKAGAARDQIIGRQPDPKCEKYR